MAQPRVVTIHYTLTNDQGEELDSSRVEGREPLS
ncbi:MAG: peptidylprolyl isomerase, partial [Marinobacter sp.]